MFHKVTVGVTEPKEQMELDVGPPLWCDFHMRTGSAFQDAMINMLGNPERAPSILQTMDEPTSASIFVHVSYLEKVTAILQEQHWLIRQDGGDDKAFADFLKTTFRHDLATVAFLWPLFEDAGLERLKTLNQKFHQIQSAVIAHAKAMSPSRVNEFARYAMTGMADMTARSREGYLQNVFDRAFDGFDEILNLDYAAENGMKTNPNERERLYEGAGLGVQTSYSTILTAIQKAGVKSGARVVDMGSGYGRVGFVVGLLRPDLEFIGYEYVSHWLVASQQAAERAGISETVKFAAQDLADPNFKIPEAEVYYLYDPFCAETYKFILDWLMKLGREKPITVITKGNAKAWLTTAVDGEGWQAPEKYDLGAVGIFRSKQHAPVELV